MRKVFLFALLAVTARLALAQKGTAATPASDPTNLLGPGSAAARMGSILNFAPSGHRRGSPRFSPLSFLTDPFLSGLYGSSYPPTASSPVIRLQSATESLAPPGDQGPQQGQPLLIELRGDRYVQISSNGTDSDEPSGPPDYFREMSGSAAAKSGRSQPDVGKTNVLRSRPRVSRGQVNTNNALAADVLPHQLAPTVLLYPMVVASKSGSTPLLTGCCMRAAITMPSDTGTRRLNWWRSTFPKRLKQIKSVALSLYFLTRPIMLL